MKRQLQAALVVVIVAFGVVASPALAAGVPTSVEVVDVGVGYVTLEFDNPNEFPVCFEYRSDGDTSQVTGGDNPNIAYNDLYPSFCLTDDSTNETFNAESYVEVRSVFGDERDLDFDWTAFEVLPESPDMGVTADLGTLTNDNDSDQESDQDQNQDEEQSQVSNQHSSHTIVQENVVSGNAGSEAISTCEAGQTNGAGNESSAGCTSDDSVEGTSTKGDVSQSSEAHQTSTIDNSQSQSQTGGSQTNAPQSSSEQVITAGVNNIDGDAINHSESTVVEHSDDDANDTHGSVINNSTGGGVEGNDEGLVLNLLNELHGVVVEVVENRVPMVIDNN